MKNSHQSGRTRTSSGRAFTTSPLSARAATAATIVAEASAKRVVDKIQVLALKRPNMLHLIEILIDGMLVDKRRADRHDMGDDSAAQGVAQDVPHQADERTGKRKR